MSLTCSVLGCDFGAVEQEQERTERSDEVIVTRREAQTCERCGRTRVLSESKEVTAIEDARKSTGATGGAPPADTSGGAPAASAGAGDPTAAAGGATDATPADGSPRAGGTSEPSTGAAADPMSGSSAAEQEAAEPGGDPGAGVGDPWNSVEDTGNATAHIESVGDSEDAAPDGEDAEIIESEPSDGPTAPPGRDPANPSTTESTGDDATDFPETEWAEAATTPGPGDEVEYDCPDCGATHPSDGSSLRPGDICPDCQAGYLEERPVERNP